MRRLAILATGIVIGMAVVLLPIERGWISSQTLRAALHGERAPAPVPATTPAAPAPAASSPAVVSGTAPFGAAAPQPLPPPPVPEAAWPAPASSASVAPIGNATQTLPPSSVPPAADELPLPPGTPPLLVPVRGVNASQLSDTFTQSRGEGRRHDAIDILAPRGTPVLAVADGRIEKLFLSKPGGRTIYQFDSEGRVAYYYAHLDAYAPQLSEGQSVKRGQVIGYVGSTGNASPEAPHLHFAIFLLGPEKRWWEGTAVNPYPLLGGG